MNWEERYLQGDTGWNLHQPSPPLVHLMQHLPPEARNWSILFPGAGESPDPAYWFSHGFKHVYVIDVSPTARKSFLSHHPDFPAHQYLIQDFFELRESKWRLIVEQTFYCAIQPEQRQAYAATMQRILLPEGELQGLWFERTFPFPGPPFGGNRHLYQSELEPFLTLMEAEICPHSASPRAGTELWMKWIPKPLHIKTTEGHSLVPQRSLPIE